MQGNFICSCDTHYEAEKEIEEMKKMEQKGEKIMNKQEFFVKNAEMDKTEGIFNNQIENYIKRLVPFAKPIGMPIAINSDMVITEPPPPSVLIMPTITPETRSRIISFTLIPKSI